MQLEKPSESVSTSSVTQLQSLLTSARFLSAKKQLQESVAQASASLTSVSASTSPELRSQFQNTIQEFVQDRGRELFFPIVTSGLGNGPLVELCDGSVKFDMITGIGVNFFGHSHPAFVEEMIDGISADVMQGNLEPGIEMKELLRTILGNVGSKARLNRGWIMCSGTMVNEVALKIIRQKKAPATKILAFNDCFAGRSTAMQEITDNPNYRVGQPVYGEVHYLPFYNSKKDLTQNIDTTLKIMKEHLTRFPDRFAALMIELVQGEGGFQYAPRDFYVKVFEEAKKNHLAIWLDEVQTFGRTGELFAYQKFDLAEWVDVVTIGKMLQSCMVLFAEEFNPKPGLVAGTFSGSTSALRTARRTLEMLTQDGFLGKSGKIEKLSSYFTLKLQKLAEGSCKGLIQEVRSIGGMIAFMPKSGTMNEVKAILMSLFDLGVIAFSCGHGPYLVRLLPPFGVMTEGHIDQVCELIEKALKNAKGQ